MVGVAEDRGEDTQRGRVGEESTHRDSGGLHRGKVWVRVPEALEWKRSSAFRRETKGVTYSAGSSCWQMDGMEVIEQVQRER